MMSILHISRNGGCPAVIFSATAWKPSFLADFREIAPPVDYSFVPAWAIFLASFVGLCLVGLLVWLWKRKPKPQLPPKTPREIALEELETIAGEIESANPYQFSIRVSDILRRYVTNQYGLPLTRQTSIEFLTALAKSKSFSMNEKTLLEDFLNRCDLIKFARYEATSADSRRLLEEAVSFVQGRSEDPKSQIPSSKEAPSSKLQTFPVLGCFLIVGIWNFLGVWGLVPGIS